MDTHNETEHVDTQHNDTQQNDLSILTLDITTLGILTHSISTQIMMPIRIMTFCKMILRIMTPSTTTLLHNDTQNNDPIVTISITYLI